MINPLIYTEVSWRFSRVGELDRIVSPDLFRRDGLPWRAGFLAGQCFVRYRAEGGVRRSPVPDFYIGAHAAVEGMAHMTRDAARYCICFPRLEILAPT
jgi:hypothetical protein